MNSLIHDRQADAIISTKEAAILLRLSIPSINRLVRENKIYSYRPTKRGWNKFRKNDIERLAGGNI